MRAAILEWSLDSPTTATEHLDNSLPLLSMKLEAVIMLKVEFPK